MEISPSHCIFFYNSIFIFLSLVIFPFCINCNPIPFLQESGYLRFFLRWGQCVGVSHACLSQLLTGPQLWLGHGVGYMSCRDLSHLLALWPIFLYCHRMKLKLVCSFHLVFLLTFLMQKFAENLSLALHCWPIVVYMCNMGFPLLFSFWFVAASIKYFPLLEL